MRRLLVLLLVAACLLPDAGPTRAQATADQLNRLSLEALTTPAPGGNPGSYRRAAHRASYRGRGRSSYGRHSYARRSYARHSYAGRRGGYRVAARSSLRPFRAGTSAHRRFYRAAFQGHRGSVGRALHTSRHHVATRPHHYRRRHR